MREIGRLRRIYGKYTAMHENIRTLHLILCVSIAIVGGNKMQMRESHAQCVRVGRSACILGDLMSVLNIDMYSGGPDECVEY